MWFVYFEKYTEGKNGPIVSEDIEHWKDLSFELIMLNGAKHGTVIEIKNND